MNGTRVGCSFIAVLSVLFERSYMKGKTVDVESSIEGATPGGTWWWLIRVNWKQNNIKDCEIRAIADIPGIVDKIIIGGMVKFHWSDHFNERSGC